MTSALLQLPFKNLSKNKMWKILFVILFFGILIISDSETRNVIYSALTDAYLQVTTFVAATLFIFYGLESIFKINTAAFFKKHEKYQVPIAAFLGALPGCGGAIMAMTQYSVGRLSFGAVVAVLTSTMGDAAFLLLAREPKTAFMIFGISLVVGIVSGYIVDAIHGYDFLRPKASSNKSIVNSIQDYPILSFVWFALFVPGFIMGILLAFQVDFETMFGVFETKYNMSLWLGSIGSILSILMWFMDESGGPAETCHYQSKTAKGVLDKTIIDTNFVTVWVILAFLMFSLTMHWTQFDFKTFFSQATYLLPLMGVLIGFLPGCGPQILVSTFYLQGFVPLSVQMANSISNDGDALFPAIAMSPKAAVLATLYTSIPALMLGYGWMLLFEM